MNSKEQEIKTNNAGDQPADDYQTEGLADLPVTAEQAQQAKGGGDLVPTDSFSLNFQKIKF